MTHTIGFNLHTSRSLKRLTPYIEEAIRTGHKVIFLDTIQRDMFFELKAKGEVRKIHPAAIVDQDDLDILFTQDACLNPPSKCSVVGIPHFHVPISYDNTDPAAYHLIIEPLAACDYLILGHNNLRKLSANDFEYLLSLIPAHKHINNKDAVIIPGGYPSLDLLIEHISKDNNKLEVILFAPGVAEGVLDVQNNKLCIETIADTIKDKKIIYSPYPAELDIQDGISITRALNNDNIELTTNTHTSAKLFSQTLVLITDTSTTGYTFSAATLRPHIQCQFNGKQNQHTRTETGWIVYSPSQLKHILQNFDKFLPEYNQSLQDKRNKDYANIGNTARYIFENIDNIANRKTSKGWISIKRRIENEYDSLTEVETLKKINRLPAGPLKKHLYYHKFIYPHHGRYIPTSESYELIKYSRALSRFNSYDLLVYRVTPDSLRYMDLIEFERIYSGNCKHPFFLSCDDKQSIDSFDLPRKYTNNNFKGYIESIATQDKTRHTLDNVFTENDNFILLVSRDSLYKRFSFVISMYLSAKKHRKRIDSPPQKDKFPLTITTANEDLALSRIQIAKIFSNQYQEKFMIWGTSNYYRLLRDRSNLPDMAECVGFIENNPEQQGQAIEGITIFSPEQAIAKFKNINIILAVSDIYVHEIKRQIISLLKKQSQINL